MAGEVRLGDGTVRAGGEVELGRLRTVAGPGATGAPGNDPIGDGVLAVLPDGSILHGGVDRRSTASPPGGADAPFAGNGSNDLDPGVRRRPGARAQPSTS